MIEKSLKDTDLGQIPQDWVIKAIRQLCSLHGRIGFRGYTKADLVKKGFGAISFSPSDIHNQVIDYSDCDYISFYKYEESPEIKVFNGDIIFCKTASIGKCAFIEGLTEKATINPQLVVLNSFQCDPKFLYYKLIESSFQNRVLSITGGSTIPTMSQEKLYDLQMCVPVDNREQRRISEALSDIDKLIAALDKKIEKQKMIKQGVMQELLTGKRRLEGFSEPWVEKRLGDILQYEQPTKYIVSSTEYLSNGIPVLTAGKTPVLGYTNEQDGVYHNLPVIIFDDFVTCSKYITFPFKVKSSAMKMLTLRTADYNLKLVYELMQMVDFPLTEHKRYWIGEYSKVVIRIPSSIDEQDAISSTLDDYDKEIQALITKREKLLSTKQGMMQQLLTGKIRLIDSLTI